MTDRDVRFSEEIDATPEIPMPQQPLITTTPQNPSPDKAKLVNRMKTKIKKMSLFASFCEDPSNIAIKNQEPGERILLFLRKSQWLNSFWGFATVFLLFLPIGIYFLRDILAPYMPPLKVILVVIPFYYLLVALYAFLHFLTWYYNAAIITTKRIINIDFHQLVMKDIAETKINLVQDVSYNQDGVLPNMFGYGQVLIQTAGTLDNFEFHHLPQPARVVEIVETLIGRKRFI